MKTRGAGSKQEWQQNRGQRGGWLNTVCAIDESGSRSCNIGGRAACERHGHGWEAARDGVASEDGWPLYLQRYVGLLSAG